MASKKQGEDGQSWAGTYTRTPIMLTLPYTTWGVAKNPCLLFLHGLLGSHTDWEAIAPSFAETHFVVALDWPGHAGSPLIDGMSLPMLCGLLKDTLCFLSCHDTCVVGYSFGGRMAMHTALAYPDLFDRVILESSSPGLDDPIQRAMRAQSDMALATQLLEEGVGPFLRTWYDNPVFGGIRHHPDFNAFLSQRSESVSHDLATMIQRFSPGVLPSLWPVVDRLPLVGFVCGERDERYVDIGQRLHQQCPGMHRRVVLNAGHNTHFEQPALFTGFIKALLERVHKTV